LTPRRAIALLVLPVLVAACGEHRVKPPVTTPAAPAAGLLISDDFGAHVRKTARVAPGQSVMAALQGAARTSFAEYLRVGTSEPPEDIKRAQGFIKEIDEAIARQQASAPTPLLVTPVSSVEEGRSRTLRVSSIVLAGLGVAAIAAGVYLSLKVRSTPNGYPRRPGMARKRPFRASS